MEISKSCAVPRESSATVSYRNHIPSDRVNFIWSTAYSAAAKRGNVFGPKLYFDQFGWVLRKPCGVYSYSVCAQFLPEKSLDLGAHICDGGVSDAASLQKVSLWRNLVARSGSQDKPLIWLWWWRSPSSSRHPIVSCLVVVFVFSCKLKSIPWRWLLCCSEYRVKGAVLIDLCLVLDAHLTLKIPRVVSMSELHMLEYHAPCGGVLSQMLSSLQVML